jgi:thiosulfate/3-mercaptopyruvate sulfurtransferase
MVFSYLAKYHTQGSDMKKLLVTLVLSIYAFALDIPSNHLIDTQWLEKNINNDNLVIIDTRKKEDYLKGHLKGAINYPKSSWFKGKVGNIPKIYNTPEQFQEMFSKAGVTEDSIVVFYSAGKDNKDFADAASGFYTAWIYGFKNSVLLNGGYSKWIEENKETTIEIAVITQSEFEVDSFNPNEIASLSDVLNAQYNEEIQIADSRVSKFYTGEVGRKDLARKGRIPTAKLTPMIRYTKKVGNHFEIISKEEASKTLNNNDYGLELDKGAIFYCNTGHKARGLWFVSKFIVGMEDVKVYEASMVEYTRTLLPIEVGESMN